MADAFNIALSGMRAAETTVAVAANNLVNTRSKDYAPIEPVQSSQETGGVVTGTRPVSPAPPPGEVPRVDEAQEIVRMTMAENAYKLSANVLRTQEEMTRTALDAFA